MWIYILITELVIDLLYAVTCGNFDVIRCDFVCVDKRIIILSLAPSSSGLI